jgi:hypothetical protein
MNPMMLVMAISRQTRHARASWSADGGSTASGSLLPRLARIGGRRPGAPQVLPSQRDKVDRGPVAVCRGAKLGQHPDLGIGAPVHPQGGDSLKQDDHRRPAAGTGVQGEGQLVASSDPGTREPAWQPARSADRSLDQHPRGWTHQHRTRLLACQR